MRREDFKASRLVFLAAAALAGSCGVDGEMELEGLVQAAEGVHVVIGSQTIVWDVQKKVVFSVKNPLPQKVQCNFSASVKVKGLRHPDKCKGTLFVDRSDDLIFPQQKQTLEMALDEAYAEMRSQCRFIDPNEDLVLTEDQADIRTDCQAVDDPVSPDPTTLPYCEANGGKGYGEIFDCGDGRRCAKTDTTYTKWCVVKETPPPPPTAPNVRCWSGDASNTYQFLSPGHYFFVETNGKAGSLDFSSATQARHVSPNWGPCQINLNYPGARRFTLRPEAGMFLSWQWDCDGTFVTGF